MSKSDPHRSLLVDARVVATEGKGPWAFTTVEILIVVSLIAIVASLVVPLVSDTRVTQLRAAAQMLVADLQFAQMESIAHGQDGRVVVFDTVNQTYHIGTQSNPTTPITNPTDGKSYTVQFGSGRASELQDVTIAGYTLDGDDRLGFGVYGQLDQTIAASITLSAAGRTVTLTLDPITGETSVGPVL